MSDHVKEEEEQVAKTEEEQEPTGKNETEHNNPRTNKLFNLQLWRKLKLEDDSKKNTNEETSKDHYSPDEDIEFIDGPSANTVCPTPTSDNSLLTGHFASRSDDTLAGYFSPYKDIKFAYDSSSDIVSPTPASDNSLATGYSASASDVTTVSHYSPDDDTESINDSSASYHIPSYHMMSPSNDIPLNEESSTTRSTTEASSYLNSESTSSRITSLDSGIYTHTESTGVEGDISDIETDDTV